MAGRPWEKYQTVTPPAAQAAPAGRPWEKYQAKGHNAAEGSLSPGVSTSSQPGFVEKAVDTASAFLQGYGQGGTLGYLPELQAGFAKFDEMLGGEKQPPYADLKEYFRNRDQGLRKESPTASVLGNLTGAVATLPTFGAVKGLSAAQQIGRGGAIGAGYGAVLNPELEGAAESSPIEQLKARLANATKGGAMGAGMVGFINRGNATLPYIAAATSGIPVRATKTYIEKMPEVDAMIANPKGYVPKVEQIQGKIQSVKDQQAVRAGNEFGQHIAKELPTNIKAPGDVEVRVSNLQNKIEGVKSVVDDAAAANQARAAESAKEAIALKAKRDAILGQKISAERQSLAQGLRERLGSDDLDGAIIERMRARSDELKALHYEKKREVGARIQKSVIDSGQPVLKIDEVFKPIDDTIAKLKSSEIYKTPAGKDEVNRLVEMRKSISEGLPENIDAESAFLLKDRLKLMSRAQNMSGGYGNRFNQNSSAIEKSMQDAALNSYRNLNAKLDKLVDTSGARKEYKQMIDLEDVLDTHFSTPEKMMKSVSDLSGADKVLVRGKVKSIKDMTGGKIDLTDDYALMDDYGKMFLPDEKLIPKQTVNKVDDYFARRAKAIENYNKAEVETRSKEIARVKQGLDRHFSTPEKTQKTLELSQRDGAHSSKQAVDELSSMTGSNLSDEAKNILNFQEIERRSLDFAKRPRDVGPASREYIETSKVVDSKFKDPEQTFKTLSGYDKQSKKFAKQNVDEISNLTGQNLADDARVLEAYRHFQDPGLLPISGGGTTSTSRSLSLNTLFGLPGEILHSPSIKRAGEAVGHYVGGPASVKAGAKTSRWLSEHAPSAPQLVPAFSPWMRLSREDKNGR